MMPSMFTLQLDEKEDAGYWRLARRHQNGKSSQQQGKLGVIRHRLIIQEIWLCDEDFLLLFYLSLCLLTP